MKQPVGIDNEFLAEIESMSTDALKARVVTLQVQAEENEAFKETPEFEAAQAAYDDAKETYQYVAGPIKETAASLKNRTKAVIKRLQERGAV